MWCLFGTLFGSLWGDCWVTFVFVLFRVAHLMHDLSKASSWGRFWVTFGSVLESLWEHPEIQPPTSHWEGGRGVDPLCAHYCRVLASHSLCKHSLFTKPTQITVLLTVVTLWACGNLPQIKSPKPLKIDLHRTVPVGGCSTFLTGFFLAEQASGIEGGRSVQGGLVQGDPATDPRGKGRPGTTYSIIFKPKRLNMHQPNRPKHSF